MAQSSFFQAGYRTRVIYTEGDKTSWFLNRSYIESRFATSNHGISLIGKVGRHDPTGDFRWGYFGHEQSAPVISGDPNGGRLSGRIYFFEPYTSLMVSASTFRSRIRAAAEVRFLDYGHTDFYVRLGLRPIEYVGLELERGQTHPLPEYSELFFDPYAEGGLIGSEGGPLFWNIPADVLSFKISADVDDKFSISYKYRHADLSAEQPSYGDSPLGTYTAEAYGGWSDASGFIEFGPRPENRHRLAYHEFRMVLDTLTFHDGGLKFAHFGIFKGGGHFWSYRFIYDDWQFAVNAGEATGSAFGTFQAWPFLEGLYRFLGERRHFILRGEINWMYASCRSFLGKVRGVSFVGMLDYVRVKPNFSYETWRPIFAGLGKDDYRAGDLDIISADLVRVRINPHYSWRQYGIHLLVSQWVPVRTRKRSDINSAPAQPGSGSQDNGPTVWGGFSASLRLSAAF